MFNFISLGAGVQSSTMALMAAHGELEPMPDGAIFADTQAEPKAVYRWLDWLERQLPFPVHRVTAGSLKDDALVMRVSSNGRIYGKTSIPAFTLSSDGSVGMVSHRDCTRDYKIVPITKAVRKLAGIKRGQRECTVTQWVGISVDEITRCKPSRYAWSKQRWPLIECRMARLSCLDWMRDRGYPEPPRSACVFCPFHSKAEWRNLKDSDPDGFDDAVQFERDLQECSNFSSTPFLNKKCVPLDTIDLSTDEERGQLSLWQDECEGMCGV